MDLVVKESRKRPSNYGGHDHTFVDDPPDDTICQICRLVARDPSQMDCCGRIYCDSCLDQLSEYSSTWLNCPNCRRDGKRFRDHRSDRQIKSLKIMCSEASQGCDWVGTMSELSTHIQKECCYAKVMCPHSECTKRVMASELQQHIKNECPYRSHECPDCGVTGPYETIMTTHREDCPAVAVECPNGCEIGGITRGSLEDHRSVCLMETISCSYADVGCEALMMRKDMDVHKAESIALHLSLAMETVVSLKKQLSSVESRSLRLEEEMKPFSRPPIAVFKVDRCVVCVCVRACA